MMKFKHKEHEGIQEETIKTLCPFVPFVLKAFLRNW